MNFIDFWYDLNGARTPARSTALEVSMLIITPKVQLAKDENMLSNMCLGNIAWGILLY
jgi:hypothetical protein